MSSARRATIWVLAMICAQMPTQICAQSTRVAVLPFENLTDDERYDALSEGLVFLVGGELAQLPGIAVVERRELDHVIREQKLQRSALFDGGGRSVLSELLGADVLVAGNYGKADSGFRIQLRAVDAGTGTILGAASGESVSGDLLEAGQTAAADLAVKLDAATAAPESARRDETPLITQQMIRGLGYYYGGRIEEALGEFMAVTRSRQTAEMARYWMARSYAELGEHDHCRIECDRYLADFPKGTRAEEIRELASRSAADALGSSD